MTTPPWGHKPPAVDDETRYSHEPPPELSARCRYWLRRYRAGHWRPNRRVRRQGYHNLAAVLGIYIWEGLHVMRPLMWADEALHKPFLVGSVVNVLAPLGPGIAVAVLPELRGTVAQRLAALAAVDEDLTARHVDRVDRVHLLTLLTGDPCTNAAYSGRPTLGA